MTLLQQLFEMARNKKRKKKNPKVEDQRNFVAKHSQNKSGAGLHQDKIGKHASRNRQKRQWRKEEGI